MTYTFKTAIRENVPLLIGLNGGSGSGKTFTGMRLASGMADGKQFAVIDTENRRALHYADQFKFDHLELNPPFRPETYTEAIKTADAAGYPVIMIDSMSHEWSGEGGILDWNEEELDRMAGDDYSKRERVKMASWIKPKMAHKKMMQTLLRVNAHIILCFRAEPKIEIVKEDGKIVIKEKQSLAGLHGWIPITEKSLPFEMTTSLMFTSDKPGIPQPIKLQEQHKVFFPLDKEVTEESGKRLADWARGNEVQKESHIECISIDQVIEIGDILRQKPEIRAELIKKYGGVAMIPADKYSKVLSRAKELCGVE